LDKWLCWVLLCICELCWFVILIECIWVASSEHCVRTKLFWALFVVMFRTCSLWCSDTPHKWHVPCPTRIRHRHLYHTCRTHYVQFERYFFILDMILIIKIKNKSLTWFWHDLRKSLLDSISMDRKIFKVLKLKVIYGYWKPIKLSLDKERTLLINFDIFF